MKNLSIIGCGKLGKVIAKKFYNADAFKINNILNTSTQSARVAIAYIGQGEEVESISQLNPEDLIMIAVPDDKIEVVALSIFNSNIGKESLNLFHTSGAHSSNLIKLNQFWKVASFHPIRSFSNLEESYDDFSGTFIGIEGDSPLLEVLKEAAISIGAKPLIVPSEKKLLYHVASVLSCSGLVSLIEASIRCLESSGIDREKSLELLMPLIEGTLESVNKRGTFSSLTGPLQRGDSNILLKQIETLTKDQPQIAKLYNALNHIALDLLKKNNSLSEEKVKEIEDVLCFSLSK